MGPNRLDGLFRIGVDEISWRKHQQVPHPRRQPSDDRHQKAFNLYRSSLLENREGLTDRHRHPKRAIAVSAGRNG
jgi:hypothetical protein